MRRVKNYSFNDLPKIEISHTEDTPLMAGKGFMQKSTNCLILTKHKNYQAIFIVKWNHYVNCFGVGDGRFDLLFTHTEKDCHMQQGIKKAKFITSTVTHQTKVVLKQGKKYFGLEIKFDSKTIKFRRKKLTKNGKQNPDFSISEIIDFGEKSKLRGLSCSLLGFGSENAELFENQPSSQRLRRILCLKNLVQKEILKVSGINHNRWRIRSISLINSNQDSMKKGRTSKVYNILIKTARAIVLFRVDLRRKKLLQKSSFSIEEIAQKIPFLRAEKDLCIGSAILEDTQKHSMILTLGRNGHINGLSAPTNWFLVKLSNIFGSISKGSCKVSSTYVKNLVRLIKFGSDEILVNMTGESPYSPKRRFLLDPQSLDLNPLREKNVFLASLREPYFDDREIEVNVVESSKGEKTYIFRTCSEIFRLSVDQIAYLFKKEGPQELFEEKNLPHLIHTFEPSENVNIDSVGGTVFFVDQQSNKLDIFHTASNPSHSFIHFSRIDSELEDLFDTPFNLGKVIFSKQLLNNDLVIVISTIDVEENEKQENGFILAKISGKTKKLEVFNSFEEDDEIDSVSSIQGVRQILLNENLLLVYYRLRRGGSRFYAFEIDSMELKNSWFFPEVCDVVLKESEIKYNRKSGNLGESGLDQPDEAQNISIRSLSSNDPNGESFFITVPSSINRSISIKKKSARWSSIDLNFVEESGKPGLKLIQIDLLSAVKEKKSAKSGDFCLVKVELEGRRYSGLNCVYLLVNVKNEKIFVVNQRFGCEKILYFDARRLEKGGYQVTLCGSNGKFLWLGLE